MSARSSPGSKPGPSSDDITPDSESEIRTRYSAARTRIPTMGVRATVLHIGAERTAVATGCQSQPEATLVLGIGSSKTARDYFKHRPPTPVELENAIVGVEDEVARARTMTAKRSTLLTTDVAMREIALIAGVPDGAEMPLALDAMERIFGRLVALTLGKPALGQGIPTDPQFAATLLILREFMHHMQFSSITVRV